jgi:hypothetical protein
VVDQTTLESLGTAARVVSAVAAVVVVLEPLAVAEAMAATEWP